MKREMHLDQSEISISIEFPSCLKLQFQLKVTSTKKLFAAII